jgi:hypothetical protein
MKASTSGQFPLDTVTHAIGTVSSVVSEVRRGVRYRVVATQDCWIAYNKTAVVGQDLFLPCKAVDYFAFGMEMDDGTNIAINVVSAFPGSIYFTPIRTVPTEG